MKSPRLALMLLLGCATAILARDQVIDAELFDRLRKLDSFTCVTKQRIPLAAKYASLCGALSDPADHTTLIGKADAAVLVHVSSEAVEAFNKEQYPLPEGTIILKEKFASPEAESPELYTGMLKREKGYNPKAGDWEFFTLSANGRSITARGRIDSCMDCHQHHAKSDFLMRDLYRKHLGTSTKVLQFQSASQLPYRLRN